MKKYKVKGWPFYYITKSGHLYHNRFGKMVRIKGSRKQSGHLTVTLVYMSKDRQTRIKKTKYIHQIVLETFLGPCPEGMEACHFPDRNPANNHINNLRWGTHRDNYRDAVKHGTLGKVGEKHPGAKLTEKEAQMVLNDCRPGQENEYAEALNVTRTTIEGIMKRRIWKHLKKQ